MKGYRPTERDLRSNPYSPDESRVCDFLLRITNNEIGCGDDPIGFLMASHEALVVWIKEYRLKTGIDRPGA